MASRVERERLPLFDQVDHCTVADDDFLLTSQVRRDTQSNGDKVGGLTEAEQQVGWAISPAVGAN
jgi:hypothetical protein